MHGRRAAWQMAGSESLGAHLPRATSWHMSSMTAVVLPVPGGPAVQGSTESVGNLRWARWAAPQAQAHRPCGLKAEHL